MEVKVHSNELKSDENFESKESQNSKCPCSTKQLLIIVVPITIVVLFCLIFFPIYYKDDDDDSSENSLEEDSIDEFEENIESYKYATLTPKNGYDNIYIHLGGISETADKYFDFFKSNSTFIPKKTKIYSLSGTIRIIKFMELFQVTDPVPCWFNVDSIGNLICDNCNGDDFKEAKESLNEILDLIDQIKNDENIDYKKIYLGGFSQGGIMTNYVLLNSRHELGGYLPFSGYFFDDHFPPNSIVSSLSDQQKEIIDKRKNYHILASHSFNDDGTDSRGYLLCHDITYKPPEKPFSFTFRYALFDSDSYDSRISVYENDVLGTFSIPNLYGHGMRVYLLGKIKLFNSLSIYARIGGSFLSEETKIDLKAEVIWRSEFR